MTKEMMKAVDRRTDLVVLYLKLQKQLASVRAKLKALPLVGHYPPNARLYLCGGCDEGPFNAHEIRLHRPVCKGK